MRWRYLEKRIGPAEITLRVMQCEVTWVLPQHARFFLY